MSDRRELQVLSRAECLDLLTTVPVGRVVLTANALPIAMPVNFMLVDGDVVFRSGEGVKLTAAEAGTVVAFEADHFDPVSRVGWSVLVTGIARRILAARELAAAERLGIPSWAEPVPAGYVRIETGVVTGRRLAPVPRGGHSVAASNR